VVVLVHLGDEKASSTGPLSQLRGDEELDDSEEVTLPNRGTPVVDEEVAAVALGEHMGEDLGEPPTDGSGVNRIEEMGGRLGGWATSLSYM
jgi:hypothetical protein